MPTERIPGAVTPSFDERVEGLLRAGPSFEVDEEVRILSRVCVPVEIIRLCGAVSLSLMFGEVEEQAAVGLGGRLAPEGGGEERFEAFALNGMKEVVML